MELSVVIPAYNEQERLPSTLRRSFDYLRDLGPTFEIIVVNDGSTDGTGDVVREFAAEHPSVRLVSYAPNRGKGAAVRVGVLEADGDMICFMDADMAVPIEEIKDLIHRLDTHDVVVGVRYGRADQSLKRRLGSRFIQMLVRLAGVTSSDSQCGFKGFQREAALKIFRNLTRPRFSFDLEVLYLADRLGYQISEQPVTWRHVDGSKVNPIRDGLAFLVDTVRIRFASDNRKLI